MSNVEAQQAEVKATVEQDIKDRLTWEIEQAERREKTTLERIKNNASSDWALMDELADVYAERPVTRYHRWALDAMEKGIPVWKTIDDLLDRVTGDVMMYRGARSTSRGANAIEEQKHVRLLNFRDSLVSMKFKTDLTK